MGFFSYTGDLKSRVSTRGGKYFASEKKRRWSLYIFAKKRARLSSSKRKDTPVHSGNVPRTEKQTALPHIQRFPRGRADGLL